MMNVVNKVVSNYKSLLTIVGGLIKIRPKILNTKIIIILQTKMNIINSKIMSLSHIYLFLNYRVYLSVRAL